MHSLVITTLVSLVLLAQACELALPKSAEVIILAFAVSFIGLPHGALDHAVGRKLLRGFSPFFAYGVFFATYLTVVGIVITGWFVSPLITVLGFFALSAWHFGLEEDERSSVNLLNWLGIVARGGMVIWVPVVFQANEVTRLLGLILPGGDLTVASQIVEIVRALTPILFLLTFCDFVSSRKEDRTVNFVKRSKRIDQLRIFTFFVLFSLADPLVSFAIYFCGWHSIRGLVHLREQTGWPAAKMLERLMPLSVAALVLFGIGFLFAVNRNIFSQAILQTVFVGLSAVAIPHLLLHVVTDSVRLNQVNGVAS
ncbi:Brp/Blh family beta-carotene 15,15'-dioxygenase [bacterium]|nr:Brp/Blh family beta-carotene 15,15'-dioxygenase [bacterium]